MALVALVGGALGYYMISRAPVQDPVASPLPPTSIEELKTTPAVLKSAMLEVTSEPMGADVFLNGALRGNTPLRVDLPLGLYEMKLTSPNHFDWEGQLQLDREGTVPLIVRMIPIQEVKRK